MLCFHPLKGSGYDFYVPLLAGDTSPTTPAPVSFTPRPAMAARTLTSGWRMRANSRRAASTPPSPYTVDENGAFTDHAPGFTGKHVINDEGEKGDANEAVIKALVDAGKLLARVTAESTQYPHSWRSKKPVIFRNTPQWFIAMDKPIAENGKAKPGDTVRARALHAISVTQWVPPSGQNSINGMIVNRPDWVISRQRA